jgi:SSS family solute:Na+ symporter/sodium/pantothenate symporter
MSFELLAETPATSNIGTLVALVVFIAASVWLGTVAQRVVQKSSFVKGFFLGNRGLGAWAVALTATVQSGGTFMGFPSLVYSYGWIVALWIGSYMVVPITGFGILGKRIAHISRKTGAITMPDLFRERFASPTLGLVTSLLIICFMTAMMVAQFKAGAMVMKLAFPASGYFSFAEDPDATIDRAYLVGLVIFSLTVVGYTLIGGFLAAVWTDLFQSVMMFFGVMLLLGLSLYAAGGLPAASQKAVESAQFAAENAAAKADPPREVGPSEGMRYASGPGFSKDGRDYLPLSLAFSFFLFWPATGLASPASVTRIMACKDTATLRQSIGLLCIYNLGIYLPLIVICICARAIIPDLEKSDEVIPRMAMLMTQGIPGGTFLSGLILAAPFGAIMATVSSYLVVIASGVVRDIYQRFLNPRATEHELRRLARVGMIGVGLIAVLLNVYPVAFLQAVVVFSSGCAGASFIVPCIMLCYWRRASAAGVMAAMLSGAATMLVLYGTGFVLGLSGFDPMIGPATSLRPYYLFGLEPLIVAVPLSAIIGVVVSLATAPPEEALLVKLFNAEEPA